MKDSSSLHQKLQEFIDCYATTDPLKEMSEVAKDITADEAGVKWLALAVLHGINQNAKKIELSRNADGDVTVLTTYRKSELPPPDGTTGEAILSTIRQILHADKDKQKSKLSVGVRQDSLDMKIKIEEKDGSEHLTLKFPKD